MNSTQNAAWEITQAIVQGKEIDLDAVLDKHGVELSDEKRAAFPSFVEMLREHYEVS